MSLNKTIGMTLITVLTCFCLWPIRTCATEYISVKNGSWHEDGVWHEPGHPGTIDDTAIIGEGTKVTVAKDTACGDITVQTNAGLVLEKGVALKVLAGGRLDLQVGGLLVNKGCDITSDAPGELFSLILAGKLSVLAGSRLGDADIQWQGKYRLSELYRECPIEDQFANIWTLMKGAVLTVDMNAGVYKIIGKADGAIRIDAVTDKGDRKLEFAARAGAGAWGERQNSKFRCIGNGYYGEGKGKYGVLLTVRGDGGSDRWWGQRFFTDITMRYTTVRNNSQFYQYWNTDMAHCRFENCNGPVRLSGAMMRVQDITVSPAPGVYILAQALPRPFSAAERVQAPGVPVNVYSYMEFLDSVLGKIILNRGHLDEACLISRNHNRVKNAYTISTHKWHLSRIRNKFRAMDNVSLNSGVLHIDENAVCNDLNILKGASLVIDKGRRLSVLGKLNNKGTLKKHGELALK